MFKYLIRLFTVFSLLFPVVTHAADFSTDFSPKFQTCVDSSKLVHCDNPVSVGCERPDLCDSSVNCTATYVGCTVTCNWSECFGGIGGDIIIPIKPAEICVEDFVPAGCSSVSYDATCNNASNPCQSSNGDGVCTCEIVKYESCTAYCQFNCGEGFYIASNTGGTIGKTCAKCTAGCLCDGVNEDCSGQPQCENGYWLNDECIACPNHATCKDGYFLTCKIGYKYTENNGVKRCDCPSDKYENPTGGCVDCPGPLINNVCIPCESGMVVNGACVDCPKNGICENGEFKCKDSFIKYYDYDTDRWACVACGDRCMKDSTTCPLYGECSTDTSNTGPEFEQCVEGFTMDLNLDAGTVKCQCTGNAYINSSGQCVACLDNAICRDEKLTGCKEGFQKVTDDSGNLIMCTGCTPNGTCLDGVFQNCNDNYYGDKNGCYKCPNFARLPGKSTSGSNQSIENCSVTAEDPDQLGEDERGYFYFETGTCNATNVTIE